MIKKNLEKKSNFMKILLFLLSSWHFAYFFTILMNEITTILIHLTFGRFEFELNLHLFEWSHTIFMNPLPDPLGSGLGPLINILLSTGLFLILWNKRSQYFVFLMGWASGSIIIGSYGLFTGNSLIAQLVGLPTALILGIIFYLIGIFIIVILRPIVYNAKSRPFWQILLTNLVVFPSFQLISMFYSGDYNVFALGVLMTVFGALLASFMEKPISKIISKSERAVNPKWTAIGLNLILLNILISIFIFSPYWFYTEKMFIADIITLSIVTGATIVGIILFIMRFNVVKTEFAVRRSFEIKTEEPTKEKVILIEKASIKGSSTEHKALRIEQPLTEVSEIKITPKKDIVQDSMPLQESLPAIKHKKEKPSKDSTEEAPSRIIQEKIPESNIYFSEAKLNSELIQTEEQIEEDLTPSEEKKEKDKLKVDEEPLLEVKELKAEDFFEEKEITPEFSDDKIISQEAKISEKETEFEEEKIEQIASLPTGDLICPYCGFNNVNDASFCVQCGQGLK